MAAAGRGGGLALGYDLAQSRKPIAVVRYQMLGVAIWYNLAFEVPS